MQLDLFEKDQFKLLLEEVAKIKQSSENVRRGLFARHNELAKLYLSLREEIDILKASYCKSKPSEILDFFNEKVS